jgi:TolB protein
LSGLYTVRSDGGDLRHIATATGANPEYSPDGTQIVSLDSPTRDLKPSAGALFVVNTDGSGLRRITPWGIAQRSGGSWSPDGRWILFQRTGGGLMVVHPDGSGLHEIVIHALAESAHAIEPRWSPDGTMILFGAVSNGQEDLYTVRSDGTDLVQITDTPNVDERRPAWGTNAG